MKKKLFISILLSVLTVVILLTFSRVQEENINVIFNNSAVNPQKISIVDQPLDKLIKNNKKLTAEQKKKIADLLKKPLSKHRYEKIYFKDSSFIPSLEKDNIIEGIRDFCKNKKEFNFMVDGHNIPVIPTTYTLASDMNSFSTGGKIKGGTQAIDEFYIGSAQLDQHKVIDITIKTRLLTFTLQYVEGSDYFVIQRKVTAGVLKQKKS